MHCHRARCRQRPDEHAGRGRRLHELFSQNDSALQPFKPGAIVGPLRLTNCRRVILHEHAIVQRNTRSVIANVSQLTAFLQSAGV